MDGLCWYLSDTSRCVIVLTMEIVLVGLSDTHNSYHNCVRDALELMGDILEIWLVDR